MAAAYSQVVSHYLRMKDKPKSEVKSSQTRKQKCAKLGSKNLPNSEVIVLSLCNYAIFLTVILYKKYLKQPAFLMAMTATDLAYRREE